MVTENPPSMPAKAARTISVMTDFAKNDRYPVPQGYDYGVAFWVQGDGAHYDQGLLNKIVADVKSDKDDFVAVSEQASAGAGFYDVKFLVRSIDAYRDLLKKIQDVFAEYEQKNSVQVKFDRPRTDLLDKASQVLSDRHMVPLV